jgi:M6 family metalloprotease-like protein
MNRVVRSATAGAFLSIAVLVAFATTAFASPADPNVIKTLKQPHGKSINVHLWGDEFIHGYETAGGYTLAYDAKSRAWKYAQRAADGTLRATSVTARPGGGGSRAKHLRPTRAAFNRSRKAHGSPPLGVPTSKFAPPWAGANTDILFLMVQFTDTACTFTPAQMQANMFGGAASGPGDLDDFFNEISRGALQMVGTVVGNQAGTGCIQLAHDRAYYNTGAANRDDDLVREAVTAADAYTDFTKFDNDNDGNIDAMGVIYAGGGPHDGCATDAPPNGSGGDNLWPHSGSVNTGGALSADGKTVAPFIINSEVTYSLADTSNCNQIQTIGLFAHELGHSMGLPDLYDTDVGSGGTSTWSTMSSQFLSTKNNADTPPHYDAWSKSFEGWVTPTVHQPGDRFIKSIAQVEDSGEVHEFRDNPGGFEIGGSGEYFLVENRQQTKFDSKLKGCGLLVWHVEESQTGNQNGGHTTAAHRLLDIDEADGNADLDANRPADAGDPFPGSSNNLLYDDSTNPNSKLYDGSSSNVRMKVQTTSCASSMTAAFGPNQKPNANAGGPYTTPEGTNVVLTAAGSNDPDGDPVTYEWDLDNDGQYDDSTSQTPTFTTVGNDGVFTVGVRVTDNQGDSSTASTTVTVTNVAPALSGIAQNGPKDEATNVTVNGLATDPGWLDELTATIDWGDGSPVTSLTTAREQNRPDATLTFSASHRYGDDGVFAVKICARDDDATTCAPAVNVTIANIKPTVAIDKTNTTTINGNPVVIGHAGAPVAFSARTTDPGSDDLTLQWDWNDGGASPDVSTLSLVNPPNADPDPSATVQPRDVVDARSQTFGGACSYDVGFKALDDDGGVASDTVKVLITGNYKYGHSNVYWANQYDRFLFREFSDSQLNCYLQIVSYVSNVFHEVNNVATFDKAHKLLLSLSTILSRADLLSSDLLTAWLNYANGAVGLDELVDTNCNGHKDTPFRAAMATAEGVRLNPASTAAQIDAQRFHVSCISATI